MTNQLKDYEIAALAIKYFGPGKAVTATALVFPESGGDADAVNPSSGATGLWQVLQSNAPGVNLKNPANNAREAAKVEREIGFRRGWVTYPPSAQHITRAQLAVAKVAASPPLFSAALSKFGVSEGGSGGLPPIPGISADSPVNIFDAPKAIYEAVKGILDFVTNKGNWLRVAAFVGGGLLLLVMLASILGKEAVKAIPAGKAVGKVAEVVS